MPIIAVVIYRGARTVRVMCPICGQLHVHGWPIGDTTAPGSRGSHCSDSDKRGPYRIVAAVVA